jgi:hypothetical protein
MFFKLIACNVFFREICLEAAASPHTIDAEFTEKGDHEKSDVLRDIIRKKIDAAEASGKNYDAILLGYGLCGNALAGIGAARTRIVLPRAHDCCTVFLGSKEKFRRHFADNPSRPFSSAGYMERGDSHINTSEVHKALGLHKTYEEYAALYGEENARYIMETLAPAADVGREKEVVFIDMPETRFLGYGRKCEEETRGAGKEFILLEGDIGLIRRLLRGEWNAGEFLVLEPGQRIVPVYDWNEVVRSGDAST